MMVGPIPPKDRKNRHSGHCSKGRGRKTRSIAGSRKAPSRGASISLHGHEDIDADASSSLLEDNKDGAGKWRFLRARKDHSRGDCGGRRGCGSDAPIVQIRFDIKPKDPPMSTRKSSDDVKVWVQ